MSLISLPKIKENWKNRPETSSNWGILKDKKFLEGLKKVSAVMFGKHGILTEGRPKLVETISLDSALSSSIDIEDGPAVLRAGVLASDGVIKKHIGNNVEIRGRALERAILEEAASSGLEPERLEQKGFKHLGRLDFNGNFLGNLYEESAWPNKIYFSGNPEMLLRGASYIYRKGEKFKKSALWQDILEKTLEQKMSLGHSVVGVSFREVGWRKVEENNNHPEDSVFVGFLVFKDSLRPDVVEHLASLKKAGVKTIFATGENPVAAHACLRDASLCNDAQLLSGNDFEHLSDRELFAALNRETVFGRLSPAHKLRISQVLQDRGETVLYIGSEYNDLPAILSANVGASLSSGEQAAQDAADIIIRDERLADLLAGLGLVIK